jgi:uncharacterized protein
VSTTIEKLLVLQDRDRRIKHLQKEQDDIPARKALIEGRLNDFRNKVQQTHENLKKNASSAKQVELEIEGHREHINKLKGQQGMVKTNEEYRAMNHEIEMAQTAIRKLEDKELTIMEEAESFKVVQHEEDQRIKQEESMVATDSRALDERLRTITGELEKLLGERRTLIADIDGTWLSRYDRVFKHTGDYALVALESGSCGGCHMKLTPQVQQDVKKGLAMISCTFCGRLLYWRP